MSGNAFLRRSRSACRQTGATALPIKTLERIASAFGWELSVQKIQIGNQKPCGKGFDYFLAVDLFMINGHN
jgi:hypothetical protein